MDWRITSAIVFVNVAVGSFIYKRAQSIGIRPGSFMVVQTFCFFLTVALAGLISGKCRFDSPYLCLAVLAGTLGITGAYSSLRSMYKGELGTNIAVTRLSFVPTAIGGILFFHESFSLQKGLLFLIAGLAVFLFFDHYRKTNRSAISSLGPALIACLAFGAFDLVYKYASMHRVNPLAFLLIQSATAHIWINLYVLFYEKYAINKAILRTAPLAGILFASACLAWLYTLREVEVSLIVPLVQMNFILTYLLGVIFFKESIAKRKLLGIAMVALATLLLSKAGNQVLDGLKTVLQNLF